MIKASVKTCLLFFFKYLIILLDKIIKVYDNKSMEKIKPIKPISKTFMNTRFPNKELENRKQYDFNSNTKSFAELLKECKEKNDEKSTEMKSDSILFTNPNFEINNELNKVQKKLNQIMAEKMYLN